MRTERRWGLVTVVAALTIGGTACTESSTGSTALVQATPAVDVQSTESHQRMVDGDGQVQAFAVGPLEFVAVGHDPGRAGISGDESAAVWVSTDGSTWNRIETDPSFVDGGMTDVVWFDKERVYVAVGRHVSEGAVWTSPDGVSWSRVALLPLSAPGGGIEVDSIVATGSGLAAFGSEWLGEGVSIPAQWTSADATTWRRVEETAGTDPDPTLRQWTAIADIEMGMSSGAVLEAVESGIVVLQTDSTTLIGFDGSKTIGKPPPLFIPAGCCGDTVALAAGKRLFLIDNSTATWVLDTESMAWRESEHERPWSGELLGSAILENELFLVSAAARTGAGQSRVAALNLGTLDWRDIGQVPSPISVGGVTTDGDRIFVAGTHQDQNNRILSRDRSPVAYQYRESDGWSLIPAPTIDGQASTVSWVEGVGLLGWNYDLDSVLLGLSGVWNSTGKVPMGISECRPQSKQVDTGVIGLCGGLAYFDAPSQTWASVPTTSPAGYVVTRDAIYELAPVPALPNHTRLSRYPLPQRAGNGP